MNYGKKRISIFLTVIVIIGILFGLTACGETENTTTTDVVITTQTSETTTESTTETTTPTTPSMESLKAEIDTEAIKPNELGEIMVVVYHRLEAENAEYDRTVESFKADLQRLYDMGFRTISMQDYINSNYNVPAGKTPIVLTFDDGSVSHFKVIKDENGKLKPDPDCVVGIMNEFCKKHPDFGRNAIFYVNADAFQEEEYMEWKIDYLLSNGYEVGNHTYGHNFLNKLSAEEVQEVIGSNEQFYKGINENISFNSFALPYGIHPVGGDESLAMDGEYKGIPYHHEIAFLVGWRPTWPLYIKGIERSGINRVQCGDMEFQLTWWLDVYEEEPEKRFISDGVSEIVTIPESWSEYLNIDMVDEERLLTY